MGFLSGLFGGPSKGEENAASSMQQAAKDMIYDSSVSFTDAQNMMKSINSQLAPITARGASQFGMSTAEEAAERTMLTEQLAAAGQNESTAVNEALASRNITPGAGISPGALAQIEGALAQKNATAQAMGQLGITERGYDIGRQNFWQATGEQGKIAGLEGEMAANFGKTGVDAQAQSFQEQQTINSQKNGMLKGLLAVGGDIAGSFIGDPQAGNQFVSAAYGTGVMPSSPGGSGGFNFTNPFASSRSGGGGSSSGLNIPGYTSGGDSSSSGGIGGAGVFGGEDF